jgi:lipoprotein-releasing system permease protein
VGEEHESTNILGTGHPYVETWLESQAVWINAIENEKMLTVMLFGVISVVAIFLIFCIFYMIVLEKTRDIGIIKSVGASSAGVAGIFLWYGLTIGIIGSGLGLLLSYVIVHNINEMHAWLGRAFGVQIWNPEVYLFDKIPNQMSSTDIQWIVPIAILASVLGALIPAIAAGRQNPVESLRWE